MHVHPFSIDNKDLNNDGNNNGNNGRLRVLSFLNLVTVQDQEYYVPDNRERHPNYCNDDSATMELDRTAHYSKIEEDCNAHEDDRYDVITQSAIKCIDDDCSDVPRQRDQIDHDNRLARIAAAEDAVPLLLVLTSWD